MCMLAFYLGNNLAKVQKKKKKKKSDCYKKNVSLENLFFREQIASFSGYSNGLC